MHLILNSIEHAVAGGCLLPAIVTTLTIPDIAGAVDNPGSRSEVRYISWIDDHFGPAHPAYARHGIDGVTMYGLRCKLLHEGLSSPSDAPVAKKSEAASRKRLIAFNVGPGASLHRCTTTDGAGDTWTVLRAETFCLEFVEVARNWLASRASDADSMDRLARQVSIRPGLPGFVGVPVICASV